MENDCRISPLIPRGKGANLACQIEGYRHITCTRQYSVCSLVWMKQTDKSASVQRINGHMPSTYSVLGRYTWYIREHPGRYSVYHVVSVWRVDQRNEAG